MSDFDTELTDLPVCPHCGEEDPDWWDGLFGVKGDGDEWSRNCGCCGRDYTVTMCVETSFTTRYEEGES